MDKQDVSGNSPDLLFAWLSPLEKKVDDHKSRNLNIPATSPLVTRATSALRKSIKASQVSRHARKIRVKEANDACLWLKAAGFPQYVQMYEDGQFPIILSKFQVEKDHSFLDQADIDSLKRRLNTLNLCADKMDEIRSHRRDSDEDINCRALSDKWQFVRRQKKWSRRSDSSKSAAECDSLLSNSEDFLEDHTEADRDSSNNYSPPLMRVSELSNSLTGLDQAVKTYSFMLNEDQVPTIQVESPQLASESDASRDLLQMSSAFSSFESEEEEEGLGYSEEGSFSFPSSSIENFATGILDAFESNMLRLKTRSLPDIFKPSNEYNKHMSSDVSPLSSASNSTTSIDPLDNSSSHQGMTHSVHPRTHPLADHKTYDPTSPRNIKMAVDTEVEWMVGEAREQGGLAHLSADEGKKVTVNKINGASGAMHNRMCSGDSLGTCSLAGSEFSEKDWCGLSSSSPIPTSRLPVMLNGFSGSDYSFQNGKEHIQISRGDASPLDELTKRISRISVSSFEANKKHEVRWHSYQRPHSYRHAFRPVRTLIPIEELSVGQISVLRKLSLVKLTALIELYKAKDSINIAKLLNAKKNKFTDTRKRKVFGMSLSMNVRMSGKALPPAILNAMEHLQKEGNLETKGLFRRAASKAKVDALKELVEENPDYSNFAGFSPYDVADMIKLYFRELPEPILTSKLSEMLIVLQESVPSQLRLPALQGIMLLIPDEHREALQVLLLFLKLVAQCSAVNQMTPQNLAVCFAPTLFSMSHSINTKAKITSNTSRRSSFKRTAVSLVLTPEQIASNKEITESVASSHCLTGMICEADKLFKVAADMLHMCRFTHLEMGDPVPYYELGLDQRGSGNLYSYLDSCVHTVLYEARKKFKSWLHVDTVNGVDVSFLKISDGVPLRVWRGVVEVDASSASIYQRLWNDRSLWDNDVLSPKVVTKIDEQTEVFQYSTPCIPPLSIRDHCLLRSWQFNVASNSYVLVSTSVSHPLASLQGGIRAMHLISFYLIEPLDNDHSRLSYLSRVDMRGRSAEFYNKCYGPYLASTVGRVKDILSNGLVETSV